MKKILYTLPLIVLTITLVFINNGCKNDDEVITPVVDQNVDKESAASKDMSSIITLLTNANSMLWMYVNNVPTGNCPNYTFDPSISSLRVNYGAFPGCGAILDNTTRSGSYILAYYNTASLDSFYTPISFQDLRIYKYTTGVDTNVIRITGFMNFSSKKNADGTFTFRAGGECLLSTNLGANKTVSLNNLTGTVNFNTLNTSTDDVYSIYGGASISDGGVTYNVSVNQTNALLINGNCRYPKTGIMKVLVGGVNTDCDFSPDAGSCDAIAKLTKGSTIKTVDYTNVDF